ncbi:amidohydrolase family protein [Streptomyces sp. NPDC049577]|uniref:amidohydrolase family protein n=1 Tax=Streptomyces sp. NPDC049577 TaxID=3155153 RepID=UPI00341999FF
MSSDAIPAPGRPPAAPPIRKIAVEEHFGHPAGMQSTHGELDLEKQAHTEGLVADTLSFLWSRLTDFEVRLRRMDDAGIDMALLSLTTPGVQAIPDRAQAVAVARDINDYLAEQVVARWPDRFAGFATVPLQDPEAAVAETERAVRDLGFKGVLVNGYSDTGDPETAEYLDLPKFRPFWEATAALGVPVYLHPRAALRRDPYQGHPELVGATWGYGPETATHALRLVYSGLFDRVPKATVILGRLGETLPSHAWRVQHCFEFNPFDKRPERRLQDYLADNFYVTTSGNHSDVALLSALLALGSDRILFSADYPYEQMDHGARWIEHTQISESDRRKICHGNAERLFGLTAGARAGG